MKMKKLLVTLSRPLPCALLSLCLCSCTGLRPLRGGHSTTGPALSGGLTQTLTQPDNPSQPSRQTQDTLRLRTYERRAHFSPQHLPPARPASGSPLPSDGRGVRGEGLPSTIDYQPSTLISDLEQTHATTELGAAQKDTSRQITAKLASLKSIVWVGLALFIFGLASLFWPSLQTLIGSVTTSAAITAGGLALMVLPTLIVGNELLILGGVVLAVALWFLAHRHGHLRGQLTATTPPSAPGPADGPSARSAGL